MKATWKPLEAHGSLTTRSTLPESLFAFPKQRKEPLTDAQHVRNAIARFDQVIDVSGEDRASAFENIKEAANYFGVNLSETSWSDLGVHPQPHREESASKGAETKKRLGIAEEAAKKAAMSAIRINFERTSAASGRP
jgi:hypothetical protein